MTNYLKLFLIVLFGLFSNSQAFAAMDSSHYSVPKDVINEASGVSSSVNYKITHNLSESPVGVSSSTNYKINAGFFIDENPILTLSISTNSVNLGTLRLDTVSTGNITLTISTNAQNGYAVQAYDNTSSGIENGFVSGLARVADATTPNIYVALPSAGTEHYGIVVTGTHAASGYASGTKINSLDDTTLVDIGSYTGFIAEDTLTVQYRASITAITPASSNYQTTSTFIATGNF